MRMQSPRVSILLITYNRPQFVGGALESVQKQSFKDWELIIVDDSEHNAVAVEVKKYLPPPGAQGGDARVAYFHRPQKGTIANASNFGLQKAQGEYIAILDDDDWWSDPDKLAKQVKFLDEHKDYVGCGGGFIVMDEHGNETGRVIKPETDEAIRRVALYANPMANATTMFRRAAAKAIGDYDESFKQFADLDFWLSMGTTGKLYNFPEYFLAYRMWASGASFKHQKENADSGRAIVMKHRHEYPGFWKAITLAVAYVVYARLPAFIRRMFNASLSRLKKSLFSG